MVAAVDFDRLRLAFCSKTLPKSPFFYVLELTFASKNPLLTSWLSILALVLRAFTQSSAPAVPVLASPVNRDAIAGNVLLGSFCFVMKPAAYSAAFMTLFGTKVEAFEFSRTTCR